MNKLKYKIEKIYLKLKKII